MTAINDKLEVSDSCALLKARYMRKKLNGQGRCNNAPCNYQLTVNTESITQKIWRTLITEFITELKHYLLTLVYYWIVVRQQLLTL